MKKHIHPCSEKTPWFRQTGPSTPYAIALALALALGHVAAFAQISIPNAGFTYTQDFNTLAASGTSTAVPAGWAFFETSNVFGGANMIYRAGDASGPYLLVTYDTYSFGATGDSDRAFGSVTSTNQDSMNSTIGACFTNNTGSIITSMTVTYTGETWRVSSQNRQDGLVFQYNQNTTAINGAGTWTLFSGLDYYNPGSPTPARGSVQHSALITATISGLNIAPGNTFCFRWLDIDAIPSVPNQNLEDALGIDDFSLSNIVVCNPPTISLPSVTQPTCATPTGTIVVNATGIGPLEYSINNGSSWQSTNTYSGQAPGNYNIKVRLQANPTCEATYGSNPVMLNPPFTASTTSDTWTGCVSTDWAVAGNWADGSVPTAADDVTIPNVANDPVIMGGTAALARSVLVQAGAVLTLNTMGSLTINNSAVHGLDNYGTVDNNGSIILGNTTAIGAIGIVHRNGGTFNNKPDGIIQIDRTLGAQAFYSNGLVNNEGAVEIGSNAAVSSEGIRLEGNTFNNKPAGSIKIDQTGSHAIRLVNTGTILNNEALIEIGNQSDVRGNGIRIGSGCTFNNMAGGHIRVNRIGIYDIEGIPCLINFGTFTNDANIAVGNDVLLYGQDGILNAGSFSNSSTGIISIEKPWGNGIWNFSGNFQNAGKITIKNIFYFEDGDFSTGILSTAAFTNQAGAEIHIDQVASGIISTRAFTNAGLIRMGENAPLTGSGIANVQGANAVFNNNEGGDISIKQTAADGIQNEANSTFNNNACATLTVFDNLNNTGTFTNTGLFTVNTTQTHTNSALTNNGLIAYPQGNLIPNVTNNEIIIAPTTANACDVISPAFGLGSPVDFTIMGIFTDEAATMPAGTYITASNTFTPTTFLSESTYTFYVKVMDGSGGCTRIIPWQLTTQNCCPVLTAAAPPAVVSSQSTCTGCVLSGGLIDPPASACPAGSTLQYSTDNGGNWSTTLPVYNPTTSITVLTRCNCDNDTNTSSPTSSVTTAPGTCTIPAAPTGALAIVNSTCTNCMVGGGSIAIGTVSGTGGTIEYSTDGGTNWSSTLPTYNQTGPAQTILASVLSANGCRSNTTTVGTTVPGICVTPAAPTGALTIVNSTCTNCMVGGGSIAIGTVSGTGGTIEYSTDGGQSWSSSLPTYNQTGPAQTILASVLSANGCRSSSVQVGQTVPGTCVTPNAPTGALAIVNSTCSNCMVGGGSIAIGTVSGSGGTIEYSTNGGTNWSSTLPTYNQTGPAQTILASVLSANGCRSSTTTVGTTVPGICVTPAAPTGALTIVNSTCTNCMVGGGSIAIGTLSGTGGTIEYSTDGGTNWSSTLPTYNQTGPAQTILASVLSTNGCRSSSVQVGQTLPGTCVTPAAPVIENNNGLALDCNNPSTMLNVATPGNYTWMLNGNPAGNGSSITASTAGTYMVTNTAANGCTASSSVIVTFTPDTTPPSITCPGTQTLVLGANCTATLPNYTTLPTTGDNCGVQSVTQSPAAGTTVSSAGDMTVTLTVTDINGLTNTCTFTVTKVDNTPPSITCPATQTLVLGSSCTAALPNYTNLATTGDNCGVQGVTQSPAAGTTVSSAGNMTVTLTVTDINGLINTCTFTVTKVDNTPPSITCPATQTLVLGSSCTAALPNYTNLATTGDNCGVQGVTQSPAAGTTVSSAGNMTVTLTVTDINGLINTCTFTVTKVDNTPPSITCPATQTLVLGSSCTATLPDYTNLATTGDNCGVQGVTQSPTAGTTVSSAGDMTVTLTVTDINGLTNTCTFTVTKVDNTAPSITCPATQTLVLGSSCTAALPNYTSLATTGDNCGVQSVTQSPAAGTPVSGAGNMTVTLTVTDINGLTNTCTFTVTKVDNTPPSITCPTTQTLVLGSSCTAALPNYTSLATTGDNCGVQSVTQSPAAGTPVSGAGNITVTLTVTDVNGLTNTCTFTVTKVDNTPPSITCPATQTLVLGSSCTAALPNYTSLATTGDNCGVQSVTQSPAAGTPVSGAGNITVTLTVTDVNGLTNTCTFTVTKVDNTPPSITCPATQTLVLGSSCTAALPNYTSLATTGDNCGVQSVTQSPTAGTPVSGAGNMTVTLTVTDINGLTNTCTFTVTKVDNTPPSITCPTTQTLVLGSSCTAALPNYTSLATTGDNCGVQSVTQSPTAGTPVSGAGNMTVTLTVTDINGLTNTCTFTVTKVDNTAPTVQCFNQTLNFNGEESIALDTDDLAEVSDNCGVQSISLSPNTISAERVGQIVPVTVTATDINGNTATCTSNITVSGFPAGWSQQPGGAGCSGNNNAYNSGTGVWTATSTNCFYGPPYTSDATSFVQRTLCGDGSLTAQVTSISGSALGWAGIVMRESNAPGAKKAQLMTNLSSLHRREFRTTTNGAAQPQQSASNGRYWLRITRAGNQFTMSVSANGTSWFLIGAQNIVMGNCIQMGLIATNYTANSTVTATFAGVSYTGSNATAATTQGVARAASLESPYSFEAYPNPTSGELNLDLSQYIGRSIRIETYSLEGKLLQFSEIEEVQNTLEHLDLKGFQSGMYLVKVKSAGLQDVTRRIVVNRN